MIFLSVAVQLISIYRAVAIFLFILFHNNLSNIANSFILITAVTSDFLDGYIARKYHVTTVGGKLLDLFSDKYLNCISAIFLIIEGYPLLPLLLIITKEIFVISFRSIEIDGNFVISTNRTLGGIMTSILWVLVLFHVNGVFVAYLPLIAKALGYTNLLYLIYKVKENYSNLKRVFQMRE